MAIASGEQILASDVNNLCTTYLTNFKVSDTLQNSNDTEQFTISLATYVKQKEVFLNDTLSVCRVKFDLKTASAGTAYGRIYRNGSATGTARSTTSTAYSTFSEDFLGFASGDLIQIYTTGTEANQYVRNMRFYYSKFIDKLGANYELLTETIEVTGIAVSMTNQDPS